MPYRSYDGYDAKKASKACALECKDPSLAVQSQRDEADINVIVKNFGLTGKMPESVRIPQFGDFDTIDDYQSAIHAIREAEASFLQLPASFREKLGNDPQRFLEYCADSNNLEEMRSLGLAVAREAPQAERSEAS